MARKSKNNRFTFTKTVSDTPMPPSDWEACEDLLAKLVARCIWAEQHLELFGGGRDEKS